MAEIVGGGPPVNDAERVVIAHLRDHGPAEWWVLHNVEIPVHGGRYEIDLIVVTGHSVCLIDVKGTRGRIEVSGHRWFPDGRQPFGSPVAKLNGHARAYKGYLEKQRRVLNRVYVDALVVLTAPNAVLVDPNSAPGADANSVTSLDGLIPMLADVSRVRVGMARDLAQYRSDLLEALTGSVQRPTGPRRFGHWTVVERLGGSDDVTEYRAANAELGGSETVLLRVYRVDPFQPEEQRNAERNALANAYRVLARMPSNECIVGSRDFFPTEDEDQFVQVLDDPHGRALHACLTDKRNPMSADVKIRVIADVLRGLAWAHGHKVIHRALSPTSVLVKPNGRAMLTGFDYARPEGPRAMTVQGKLSDVLDPAYVAPECQGRVQQMSRASDVYAVGVIAFQLLTGELPFTTTVEQFEKGSVLPTSVLARAGVSEELTALLQRLCALAPSARPSAAEAFQQFGRIVGGRRPGKEQGAKEKTAPEKIDLRNLPEGHQLTPQYTIRRKLGAGTFGVVYQVYDNLAGADRVVKIVDRDRESQVERLRQEYKILLGLPPHSNVVKVESAGYLEGGTVPYLVFEYLDGRDLKDLLKEGALNPADALAVGRDLAAGLTFLHGRGVYHCDVKPNNVFRTDQGCKILDFNVAVSAESSLTRAGGNHRYVPPDVTDGGPMNADRLIDRDIYGAGLILYEALTGNWPFENAGRPVLSELPRDPRESPGLSDLSDELATTVLKAIAPLRSDRFASADEFCKALEAIGDRIRKPRETPPPGPVPAPPGGGPLGTNPFVDHLQTLYSQSTSSNAGTRGHDPYKLYVATLLDNELRKDVLAGKFRLVVITGNAGDGKTAFLEALVARALDEGATAGPPRVNGADIRLLNGTWLRTNYDGSQDEGKRGNDEVLLDFFAPFRDGAAPDGDIRLIAINEGRLVDFCVTQADSFGSLTQAVRAGLDGGAPSEGIAVVNLNRRSLVADPELDGSIFERILEQMTAEKNWEACGSCELARRCFARHNAVTLGHPNAGPKVVSRLKELYTLTHLRGKLHMTVRDVRSALAYTLTSGRGCEQIHDLYRDGDTRAILDGFYFNSWAGLPASADRLLTLLREIDVAKVPEPALDRKLDYVGPDAGQALMRVDGRDDYDLELLEALFSQLPRTPKPTAAQTELHSRYLAAARRRFFFECVDEQRVRQLLPYRSATTFLELLASPEKARTYVAEIIEAINRGEGLPEPDRFGGDLALQIREVVGGTIRSYRLFPKENLSLSATGSDSAPYLETQRDGLLLRHRADSGHEARLRIGLDLFEFLHRLRHGHLPGLADEQGLLLGLTIFKNELAAAPYQEILLTSGGDDLHRVQRHPDGRLVMRTMGMGVN
ncbi:methylation-associated defense system protein kinase MAD6 [Nocardia farcinica]|uniref:methylation-associated defense system protein kinase MAD6 n=1 Tax=Nocardia farcinica TaxID=37329 RepID=UPI000E07145E|nr:protein kinase [Nocardia farcinica]MBF6361913.1 protein kinase [Nocardia farcinica]SUE30241.1 protein kinase/ LuxR family transcriptional regulator [Nocardia farcinica]